MANLGGFHALGHFLAGGNAPQAALAEAQGEQLGANTQAAIAKALETQQKTQARAGNAKLAAALPGSSPELGAYLGNAAEGEFDPRQGIESVGFNQKNRAGEMILNPDTSDAMAARANLVRDPASHGLVNPLGEGMLGNALHPDTAPIQTPISESVAAKNNAEAALHNAEASHPEKYHFPPMGSVPIGDDRMAQVAEMRNAGFRDQATRYNMTPAAIDSDWAAYQAQRSTGANTGGNAHALLLAADKAYQPGGKEYPKIVAGNQLTYHLGTLQQLADAADAHDLPTVQKIASMFNVQAGSDIPTMAKLISQRVGDELENFIVQNGGTLEGRQEAHGAFNQAEMGAQQLRGNVEVANKLMEPRFGAMKKGYLSSPGRTGVDADNFARRFLNPAAADRLAKFEAEAGPIRPWAPDAAALSAPGAPLPVAAPAGAAPGGLPPGWTVAVH